MISNDSLRVLKKILNFEKKFQLIFICIFQKKCPCILVVFLIVILSHPNPSPNPWKYNQLLKPQA
jgi:hypothetical protein